MDEYYKRIEIEISEGREIYATEKGLKELKNACQRAIDEDYATTKDLGKTIHISKEEKEYFKRMPGPETLFDYIGDIFLFFFIFGIWGIGIFATIKWLFW